MRLSRRVASWPVLALIIGLGVCVWLAQGWLSDLARREVVAGLESRFDARARLSSFEIHLLPRVRVAGGGLELRYQGRTDLPPLLVVRHFEASAGLLELLRQHIHVVRVEGLVLTLPPDQGNAEKPDGHSPPPSRRASQPPSQQTAIGGLVIDTIATDRAAIVILPRKADREPLRWDIAHLEVHDFQFERPSAYVATLTNPKPQGEIACQGRFGPWNAADPGATPVEGHYRFTNVDLATISGIAGTLRSEGQYDGRLSSISARGTTETPDFRLGPRGHAVPLETRFDALIDGTNGNTWLRHVHAIIGGSPLDVSGAIVQTPGAHHRTIEVNVKARQAHLEDLLQLAMREDDPPLTGDLAVDAHLVIPPGDEDVVRRVALDGTFTVSRGHFTSDGVQAKVDTLSRRGRGQPKDEDIRNVLSTFSGRFDLHHGVLHLPKLAFAVNGAQVHLAGTYALDGEGLNFQGDLRLKARLSQTMTGVKSFFLKLIDPLFAKHGAGTFLPISVTGTVQHPAFDVKLGKALSPE